MTNPTKEQVLACNDKQQLSEWVATICYGWSEHINGIFHTWCKPIGDEDDHLELEAVIDYDKFNPCSPTVEGKAQAVDLAVKYKLEVDFAAEAVVYYNPFKSLIFWDKGTEPLWNNQDKAATWQLAIVKAVIISALSEVEK